MESTPDNFAKKFMNTLVRRKKIDDFESSVSASLKIIMAIKNREQRLTSLLQLQKDIEKDIDEIVMLSDIKRPIQEKMTLAEYLDINVPPTKESIKRKQDRAIINRLKDYKTPIIQEMQN